MFNNKVLLSESDMTEIYVGLATAAALPSFVGIIYQEPGSGTSKHHAHVESFVDKYLHGIVTVADWYASVAIPPSLELTIFKVLLRSGTLT
jgi:hypothetical protein